METMFGFDMIFTILPIFRISGAYTGDFTITD